MNSGDQEVRQIGQQGPAHIVVESGRLMPGRHVLAPYSRLASAEAAGVDFSGQRLQYLNTEGCTFVRCDFSRLTVTTGYLDSTRTSHFVECRFDRFRPGSMLWGVSRFEDCSFRGVSFRDWRPQAAEFINCTFTGRIDGAVLSRSPGAPHDARDRLVPWREFNEFHGNDFSQADLRSLDFRGGVNLTDNSWPTDGYLLFDRWQDRLIHAISAVSRWENDQERERALWWLRLHRSSGRELQQTNLVRQADWSEIEPRSVWDRLWELLADT